MMRPESATCACAPRGRCAGGGSMGNRFHLLPAHLQECEARPALDFHKSSQVFCTLLLGGQGWVSWCSFEGTLLTPQGVAAFARLHIDTSDKSFRPVHRPLPCSLLAGSPFVR